MRTFIVFFLLVVSAAVFADPDSMSGPVSASVSGIGEVANNLLGTVNILSEFFCSTSFIVGGCALFASLLKYMQYRVNSLAVPLSSVIVLFITGVALVGLPFVYLLTESGIPFTFFSH